MKIIIKLIMLLMVSLPVVSEVKNVPDGIINAAGYNAYQKYLKEKNNKAFAISENGAWSWNAAQASLEKAKNLAIKDCEAKKRGKCDIIDADGDLSVSTFEAPGFLEKITTPVNELEFFPASIQEINQTKDYKNNYLLALGNKAFAASISGAIGWSSQHITLDDAKNSAIKTCEKYNTDKNKPCIVVDLNGQVISDKLKFTDIYLASRMVYPEMTVQLVELVDYGVYLGYKKLMGHKAIAVAPSGYRHLVGMMTTAEYAKQAALKTCKRNSGQQCKVVLVDQYIVYEPPADTNDGLGVDKPWYGKYLVDLEVAPHLIERKESLPIFFFHEKEVSVSISGKEVIRTTYLVRNHALTMIYKGAAKTGTFSNGFKTLILHDGNKSQYVRAVE